MKSNFFFAVLLLAIITACNKKDDDTNPPLPPSVDPDPVQLSALEAGQQSMYVRYYLDCTDPDNSFAWTNDTLLLEVERKEGGLQLQESLTPESPMFLNGQFQEPVEYPVETENGYILLPDRSNSALFFFYANDTIHLDPVHDVELVQNDCALLQDNNPFIGNDIGMVEDFRIGPIHHQEITAISCEPFFNLDAYLLYSKDHLHTSHVFTFDTLSVAVFGWHLLK